MGRIPATTEARPVGGLLGKSEYFKKEAVVKTKFKPKFTRKARVVDDDDDLCVVVLQSSCWRRTAGSELVGGWAVAAWSTRAGC